MGSWCRTWCLAGKTDGMFDGSARQRARCRRHRPAWIGSLIAGVVFQTTTVIAWLIWQPSSTPINCLCRAASRPHRLPLPSGCQYVHWLYNLNRALIAPDDSQRATKQSIERRRNSRHVEEAVAASKPPNRARTIGFAPPAGIANAFA